MRNTVIKVGLFLCAIIFMSTNQANALSSKDLALTEDPFRYAKRENEPKKEQTKPPKDSEETQPADEPAAEIKEKTPLQHIVVAGESLSKIAAVHGTTWGRLYAKNTHLTSPDLIEVNSVITIPEPAEILAERPLPAASAISATAASPAPSGASGPQLANSAGNTYTPGYCTWYAKSRRPDLPNRLGNASSWVARAAAQGFATGGTPQAGAIGQQGNHVVYVERVNSDGTVTVSEMNYTGLFAISNRTVAAGNFTYIY